MAESALARPTATAVAGAVGRGTANGTFGELLQGRLPGSRRDFLVTLPITRWSTACFRWGPDQPLFVEPAGKLKSHRLAERILRRHGIPGGGLLTVESDLPEGKGLASSSADLVATARAVGHAFGLAMPATEIEDLIRPLEPTDGVMHDGATAFYHREVRLCARLGHLPPLTVVGIDEGGVTDTIRFNQRPKPYSHGDMHEYARLLATLSEAVRIGDAVVIGQVATRSSVMNQRLDEKQLLPRLLEICAAHGGLGVVVAHSGTTLGILLNSQDPGYAEQLDKVVDACRIEAGDVTLDQVLGLTTPAAYSS